MKAGFRFSFLLTAAAFACGSLAFLAWYLAVAHLYATSILAVVVLVAVALAWARRVAVLDRSLASIVAGRPGEVATRSALTRAALPDSLSALDTRSSSSTAAQIERHQHLEHLQALVDTVPAALFVLGPDEKMRAVNRAARRFESVAAIGDAGARELRSLRPGSRRIVVLGPGIRYLVLATQFRAPGRESELLLSIQPIAGELDIVELEAWQNMTRVLAHEMMNSLTPIVSLSESLEALIQRARLPDSTGSDIPEAIEAIRRRSAGLLSFVQRYRQMSDLPQPVLKPVRLDEFVNGLVTLMGSQFRDKGIAFRSTLAEPNLVVHADAELLAHLVINLLTNAIEAVSAVAQPVVELSCERVEDEIVLAVRDNGAGVSVHEREQVFVPFYTTKPSGSGIGLSLARQIAIAHGGKLEVKPDFPGCEFRLTLAGLRAASRVE